MLLTVGVLATLAARSPSCTNWMKQNNGCYWMECVGDDGVQRCYEQCPGQRVAHQVRCQ
jgi:hypothetical protein